MTYIENREIIGSGRWSAQTLVDKFFEKHRTPNPQKGIESYNNLPSEIDCTPWLSVFEELRAESESTFKEPLLIQTARPWGFETIYKVLGDESSVRLKYTGPLIQQVAFHAHPPKWKELPHEKYRNGLKQVTIEDSLSTLDKFKNIISLIEFDCFGVVHKRSVIFLLRSYETPLHNSENPLTVLKYLTTFMKDEVWPLIRHFKTLYENSHVENNIIALLDRQSNIVFAKQHKSALYQIPNYYISPVAIRLA